MNSIKILFVFLIALAFNSEVKAQEGSLIGEVKLFAGHFAHRGWAFCDGQVLHVSENTVLFSILKYRCGGNGGSNFALPDLRGRTPIGSGTGPGLSSNKIGQKGGSENMVGADEFIAQYPTEPGTESRSVFIHNQKNGNSIRDPYLALNYIVCVYGIVPPRY
jgi:microcystin-dependent protein